MTTQPTPRRAVAAVEFAVCFPLLLTLMVGTWEVGRLIQAHEVLVNAVREGARLAAQGKIVNVTGSYTEILKDTGTPNVTTTVTNYVRAAPFRVDNIDVTFTFVDGTNNPVGNPVHPWQGAKGQRFRVRVTLPYDNVRLTTMGIVNITTMSAETFWTSMNDDPFLINQNVPSW